MKIRITVDTSTPVLPRDCRNWLHYWEQRSGFRVVYCCAINCCAPAEKGAHVRKEGALLTWEPIYIVPLCLECYSLASMIEIQTERRFAVMAPNSN